MAKILFGYRNLMFESDVAITAGDEAGDFVDDNLLKPHPSSFWRADNLAASWLNIDLGATRQYGLVALLYHTATNRRSFLTDTESIDTSAEWTRTNVSVAPDNTITAPDSNATTQYSITASGAGSVEHKILWSENLFSYSSDDDVAVDNHPIVLVVAELNGTSGGNAKLTWNFAGATGAAEFDLQNGTVNGTPTSSSGDWTASATITSMGSGWYRCALQFANNGFGWASATLLSTAELFVLDSSFNDTYTQAGESIKCAAIHASIHPRDNPTVSVPLFEPNNTNDQGAIWLVKNGTAAITSPTAAYVEAIPPLSVASSELMATWRDSRGHGHCWHQFVGSRRYLFIEIHDPDNAAGQVDVSNVYIGPVFQPSHNLSDPADFEEVIEEDYRSAMAGGGQQYRGATGIYRRWRIRLPYQTKADAEGSLMEMGLKLGKTQPVLVIRDPDESTYGQQSILYGYIDVLSRVGMWLNADGTLRYAVTLNLRELLP